MFNELFSFYVGGLLVLTMVAVTHAKPDSAWDLSSNPEKAIPLILFWPITLPVSFLITRLGQI